MATQVQIEANRRNSQQSTGPRTEAGKIKCSQNAFKSGIYAEAPLVTGENPADLDGLALAYRDTWRPSNPDEHALVETLIYTDWLLRRMRRVETQYWNRRTDRLHQDSFYEGDPAYELVATYGGIQEELDRIQRRLNSLDRAYRRTLADLRRLRADRPLPPDPEPVLQPAKPIASAPTIGFVPSENTPAAQHQSAPVGIGFVPSNPATARSATSPQPPFPGAKRDHSPAPSPKPPAPFPREAPPAPLTTPRATLTPEGVNQ